MSEDIVQEFEQLVLSSELRDGEEIHFVELLRPTEVGGQAGLRKTSSSNNSLAHRTTWLRSDLTPLCNSMRQCVPISFRGTSYGLNE